MISWKQFALPAFRPDEQPALRDVTEAAARGVQSSAVRLHHGPLDDVDLAP